MLRAGAPDPFKAVALVANISTTTQSELRHDKWPHPRVRTSPEVGPGATVGTPGLGYPLLLCLGKGLIVILDYVQAAGPLWSGAPAVRAERLPLPGHAAFLDLSQS